jgi:hypothetical protein
MLVDAMQCRLLPGRRPTAKRKGTFKFFFLSSKILVYFEVTKIVKPRSLLFFF